MLLIALFLAASPSEAENFEHRGVKCVVIDPGHGSPDGGAVGKNNLIESSLNLQVALKLREELIERGYDVIMTREDEDALDAKKKTDMQKRLEIMKNADADIFVSIHMNKFSQSKYRGAEVLYSNNYIQSELLAQLIMSEIREIDPDNQTRTIKEAERSLYLMKNATLPAVIVECGFLSNDEEAQLLSDKSYQSRLAGAICEGIISYYKNVDSFTDSITKTEGSD